MGFFVGISICAINNYLHLLTDACIEKPYGTRIWGLGGKLINN